MKMRSFWQRSRYRDTAAPEVLPGVQKKSFALPFHGGEIWFEHLDGIYQYTDLVLDKLRRDSGTFLLPSSPACVGVVLDETLVTGALVGELADLLCGGRKTFLRVCFIGADRKTARQLRSALRGRSRFGFAFIDDVEKAKDWLIPAQSSAL